MNIEELYAVRCMTKHNIDRHMPLLRYLAAQCNHITEFGRDEGFSTTAFLAAQPETLYSYDIAEHPNFEDVWRAWQRSDAKTRFFYNMSGNTLEIEIEETDLLFIDTEHTYAQVAGELSLHGDKARKFIVLHDIVSFPCIVPAIREWLHGRPEWIVREWSLVQSGMAVLERREPVKPSAVYEGEAPCLDAP